jgi:hypothetical protein
MGTGQDGLAAPEDGTVPTDSLTPSDPASAPLTDCAACVATPIGRRD